MRKKMKKQLIRSYIVIIISFILLGTLLLAATIMDAEAVDFKQAGYIGGPLLYIISIYLIYFMIKKDCFKEIKQYLADHPDITMEDLEDDFSKAEAMGNRVWIGERWTFYINDLSIPKVIEHGKIVWAYYYSEQHGKAHYRDIYIYI